jgi:hypothetical protein
MAESSRPTADQFFPGLFTVLRVLEPYLINRGTPGAATHEQLFTRDIDLAVPVDLHADAEQIDALLLESGLRCEFR